MKEKRPAHHPDAEEARIVDLPGGPTLVLQENHDTKVVSILFFVKVGSADESDAEAGLAHLHEHMIFKGTPARPVGRIAAEVEGAGGEINAYTTFDHTCYMVTIASRYWTTGLDVLADALQHALFDKTELAKELDVVFEEMSRSDDAPMSRVSENILGVLYRRHPYRRPIIGTRKALRGITRREVRGFFKRWYALSNVVAVIAGDFDAADAEARVRGLFPKRAARPVIRPERPMEKEMRAPRVRLEFGEVREATFLVAWPAVAFDHADAPMGDLLAGVLGGGESSRLNVRVKRRRRVVFHAFGYNYSPVDAGFFAVGAVCDPRKTGRALAALLDEISRARRTLVTPAEMEKARAQIESQFVYQRETPSGLSSKLGYSYIHTGGLDFDDFYLKRIFEATRPDLRRFAQNYLAPEKINLCLLLPNSFRGQLSKEDLLSIIESHGKSKTIAAPLADKAAKSADKSAAVPASINATRGARRRLRMFTLENGVRVIVKESAQAPLVSMRACLAAGTRLEPAREAGISRFVSSLLTKGTSRRDAEEYAEAVESLAGGVSGFSGRNSLGLSGDFLSRHFEVGMELMAEALLTPSFPEKEIDMHRIDQAAALVRREDYLEQWSLDIFLETLYRTHPYGRCSLGTIDSLRDMNRASLRRFHRGVVRPENLVLGIAGDVSVEQAGDAARRLFGRFKANGGPLPAPKPEPRWKGARIAKVEREKEQAHLVIGFLGSQVRSRDRHAMDVLIDILSGQGGRLFMELRDRGHMAYSVSGFHMDGPEPGVVAFYIGTSHASVERARDGIWREIERIREETVGADELSSAKRHLVGSAEISSAYLSSVAQTPALDELLGLGWREHLRTAERIGAVTAKEVRDAARRYFTPDAYAEALITKA